MTKQKISTTTQQKIPLDKVYNPHPKLLQAYEEKNGMELFTAFENLKPEYVLEDRLFKIQKMSGAPIKHHIGGIYRQAINGKEYVLWHEHLSTADFYQNPVDHTRFMGRISLPDIVTRYSLPTTIRSDIGKLEASAQPPEITGHHTEYLYPFEEMKDQLQEWYSKKIITDDTRFYYWDNQGVKNPVRSFDDFLNLSGDDLILLGKSKHKLSGVFKSEERASMLESLRAQIKEEMKDSGFFTNKK